MVSKTVKYWVAFIGTETEVTMGSLRCNPGDMGGDLGLKGSRLTRLLSASLLRDLIQNLGVLNVHWDLDSGKNSGQQ